MKIITSPKKIGKFLLDYLNIIIYTIGVLILVWLAGFTYSNVYTSVINPKDVDQSEIIAKRQKVNIQLFDSIDTEIEKKKSVNSLLIKESKDPFSELGSSVETENEQP